MSKTETLNLRISSKLKAALRLASEKEHRSVSNMVEFLVLSYCREHELIEELGKPKETDQK